jgi:hypothetical protein
LFHSLETVKILDRRSVLWWLDDDNNGDVLDGRFPFHHACLGSNVETAKFLFGLYPESTYGLCDLLRRGEPLSVHKVS